MFQKIADLKGSFVNDEYVVKRFDQCHLDRENECFQKSRKLLKALDDEWNSGSCICDRLPGLVSYICIYLLFSKLYVVMLSF